MCPHIAGWLDPSLWAPSGDLVTAAPPATRQSTPRSRSEYRYNCIIYIIYKISIMWAGVRGGQEAVAQTVHQVLRDGLPVSISIVQYTSEASIS